MQEAPTRIKVFVFGYWGVGITSLVNRFVHEYFSPKNQSRNIHGASHMGKILHFNDKMIKFNIWWTSGRERYDDLDEFYYRDVNAIIMVYDITNRNSFEALKRWHKGLQDFGIKDIVFTIVGNTEDLFEIEVIPEEEAKEYAENIGALYRKTSAKTGYGVEQVFRDIATKMFSDLENQMPQAKRETVVMQLNIPAKDGKKRLCYK